MGMTVASLLVSAASDGASVYPRALALPFSRRGISEAETGWISEIFLLCLGFGPLRRILLKGFRKGSKHVGWKTERWDGLMVSDRTRAIP